MGEHTLSVEDAPRREDIAALEERLDEYNAAVTGCHNGRDLAIFVHDAAGSLVAGLHGWTWGHTGFVRTLWVTEALRGQGLGRCLLTAAEEEAVRRGCRVMRLATHSYQAPGFYRRLGYDPIAELPGWPGHSTVLYLRKTL